MSKKHTEPTNKALVAIGIHPATASEMMNGKKLPSLERAVLVEDRLGIPPRYWVERFNPSKPRRASVGVTR